MSRPYKVLRNLIDAHELTQEQVADYVGCSKSSISHKLNLRNAWTSDEMWKLMELFKQPPNKLHELFPAHGKA